MLVGAHGGERETVDDFVGAGLDDGKYYTAFDDEAALSRCAAFQPAFGSYLGPVVGYRLDSPALEGVPKTVVDVISIKASSDAVKTNR